MGKGRSDTLLALLVIVGAILLWQHAFTLGLVRSLEGLFIKPEKPYKNYEYVCNGGHGFQVLFYGGNVHLHIDGKNFILSQVSQASSTTYSTPDGSTIFVDEMNTGVVMQNHVQTYMNCIPGVNNYS